MPASWARERPSATWIASSRSLRTAGPGPQQLAQGLALHELHRDVGDRSGLADLEHGDDVRVAQRRDDPRLLLESLEPVAVDRELLGQELERDVTVEARVARAVDLAHPAGPDALDDFVGPEPRPGAPAARRAHWLRAVCVETPLKRRRVIDRRPDADFVPVRERHGAPYRFAPQEGPVLAAEVLQRRVVSGDHDSRVLPRHAVHVDPGDRFPSRPSTLIPSTSEISRSPQTRRKPRRARGSPSGRASAWNA